MSKKSRNNKNRSIHTTWVKSVTQGNKPYLYEMPQDAEEVAVLAGAVAFQAATFDFPQKRSNDLLLSGAKERTHAVLQSSKSSGQQLTNDQEEFDAFFEDCLIQVYHIVMETYTANPSEPQKVKQILSQLPPQEAMAYCQSVSRKNLDSVGVRTND